ncbi:MAG: M14 family zinc carboxypeptidase [Thermoplasmatota archaeon]
MKRALLVLLLLPLASAQVPDATFVWPQHDDVQAALEAAAQTDWVTLHTVGTSEGGKPLVVAEITDPASDVPMADRVVTLITTQQHGNEPAGTPAAIQLLGDIQAGGPITQTLGNQVLLLWPQANPDGALANTRGNAGGTDLNRDHVHVNEPEAQALHEVILQRWDVHMGMDHHEYSGTGLGYPVPVRTYDWDATILYPRHGNVREPTQDQAEAIYDALVDGLAGEGYNAGEYGVQTVAGVPVSHVAGGPDPGILRNNFGLNNVAGLLVETFVNPANPLVTPERRIDIHYHVMQDTLAYGSANAEALIEAKRNSERLNLEQPLAEYLETWPADPLTGEANAGDIRAPLAAAYRTEGPLSQVMQRHGLPAGFNGTDGWTYNVVNERQGLLAAILHPESSRVVAPTVATEAIHVQQPATPIEEPAEESPALPVALLLVALAILARKTA